MTSPFGIPPVIDDHKINQERHGCGIVRTMWKKRGRETKDDDDDDNASPKASGTISNLS